LPQAVTDPVSIEAPDCSSQEIRRRLVMLDMLLRFVTAIPAHFFICGAVIGICGAFIAMYYVYYVLPPEQTTATAEELLEIGDNR
jgi:hypothetical protein